ncbi:hypothetical protein B0H16DRAFT_1661727 [Mycena metata]|uniref:mRNA 3'-end-processing protein RNA14 n=1 Tax=Mycena metata TaxID=1033252 RepID=A0AAD7NKL2_9AGAR|nr:hypothetical protein B0H16DRAFT_1661727 [Mycena metata]
MGLNKITTKKSMSDLSPAHMQARTVLRQLTIYLNGAFSGQEPYLKWEEGNPLAIEEKDHALLISRIQMVYRKAVICMRYYPEIWSVASIFSCFALTYAYAELLEKSQLTKDHRDFTEIHSIYERFFGVLCVELARLTVMASEPAVEVPNGDATDPEAAPADPPTEEELAERKKNQEELPELKKQYSNTWINYMRLARRAQGHKVCCDVFGKAPMTEYRCNLEDGRLVAARIFETGMKKYSSHSTYILSHLGFLLTVNDENSMLYWSLHPVPLLPVV